ncbi:MAG: catalytic domain of component of various dehydrogenase complexe [Actinomycetia bacterium]|nr:catalytic domain of component of various dehydrogenase complexe [Actinomycetes bacterium]
MSELKQFKLPDVGEGLTEADIVRWLVKVGDPVEVNQIIVEIETAKAIVELPCPYEGVVARLHAAEGETVDVGLPIITIDTDPTTPTPPSAGPDTGSASGTGSAVAAELHPSPVADPGTHIGPTVGPTPGPAGSSAPDEPDSGEPKRTPVLVGYGVKPGATHRRPRKPAHPQPVDNPPAARPILESVQPARPQPAELAPALAKPPVRKLAKDLGVDLTMIAGTGPQGSITRADLQASAPLTRGVSRTESADSAGNAGLYWTTQREERVAVKGVRKATAAAMVRSAFSAPHVTEFLQVDVTESMAAVRRLRELPEFEGVKVSPLLLVAKALLTAVARHPMINSSWDEETIVVKHYVNLGIAAATERGLIVPNIKDAGTLTLPGLARELTTLAETARAGRTSLEALTGGTITITNVGVFGIDAGTPILTPGESAILAFGQIRDLPWVHEGEIAVRKVTTLSLSFDHRIVDGDLGSAVLRDVGAMLQDPLRVLAWT